jgi:hypothetical protein
MAGEDLYALTERLPKDDPAWDLLDAFDAVTNGMENPGALQKAYRLKTPALEPWIFLIKAIHFLYAGNCEQCREAAEKIPETSLPGRLKPVFRAWLVLKNKAGREKLFEELSGSGEKVTELFEWLILEPHPLFLAAEQAEEALRQDLPEQFCLLAAKVLSGLYEESPAAAYRYGVRCFALLAGGTPSVREDFFQLAVKIFGEDGARRALGLAFGGSGTAFFSETSREITDTARKKHVRQPVQQDLFQDKDRKEKHEEIPAVPGILPLPPAFEEIASLLPPALRYLGPGVWMKALKDKENL